MKIFQYGSLAILVASGGPLAAKDYGVFVDGGFGTGQPEMNGLVDQRIDKAKEVFDKRHPPPGGASSRVDSKAGLEGAMNAIECLPGDTITLVMMGHGSPNNFHFSLAATAAAKNLAAAQLNALIARHPNCCVRVVMFACHSGSFIDNLFENPNVYAVYTSCRAGEKSFSDAVYVAGGGFQDNGDWMKGWNEDWEAALAGLDIGEALDTASESAWDSVPLAFADRQHPSGWRTGEHPVKAHVEADFGPTSNTARVHFYCPVFMRCKTQDVRIDRSRATITRRYKDCEWIEFPATFGRPREDGTPRDPIVMGGSPTDAAKPQETIIAHVEGRGSGRLAIHTIEPNWLFCRRRTLIVPEPFSFSDQLRACSWIKEEVTVEEPLGPVTAGGNVEPFDFVTPVVAHIENRRISKGQICIRIRQPSFLTFITQNAPIYVAVPPDQVRNLSVCDMVRMDLKLRPMGDGLYTASNLVEVDQQRRVSNSFDAGMDEILFPGFDPPVGDPIFPTVEVRNMGTSAITGGQVSVVITNDAQATVFSGEVPLSPIAADGAQIVQFQSWLPAVQGNYRATFTTALPNDENPDNDELMLDFVVGGPEATPPEEATWRSTLIGNPGFQPPFTIEEDTVAQLLGQGNGLGNQGDNHSFVFQPMLGDFAVSCLVPMGQLQPGRSMGTIVRMDEQPQAPMVGVVATGGAGLEFVVRPAPGAQLNRQPIPVTGQMVWLGMRRQGNQFMAEVSMDRVQWNPAGNHQFQQPMPNVMLAGVLAASPNPMPFGFAFGGFGGALTPIERPAEVAARALGPGSVQLIWSDRSKTESGFAIERALGNGAFAPLTTVPANATSFTDSGLPGTTEVVYRVRALTFYDNVDWSPPASAETWGAGIDAWAAGQGVTDLFTDPLGDGTPTIYHYLIGASATTRQPLSPPSLPLDPGFGLPLLEIIKAPGVFDVRAEWQLLTEDLTWETIHTLLPSARPGRHEFLAPLTLDGRSIVRLRLTRM